MFNLTRDKILLQRNINAITIRRANTTLHQYASKNPAFQKFRETCSMRHRATQRDNKVMNLSPIICTHYFKALNQQMNCRNSQQRCKHGRRQTFPFATPMVNTVSELLILRVNKPNNNDPCVNNLSTEKDILAHL